MKNVTVTKTVQCSAPADELHFSENLGTVAEMESRVMGGIVLPWDEEGVTSGGTLKFSPGSIQIPSDLSRVKLLAGHSPNGHLIGHAIEAEERDEGLFMKFSIAESELGDAAIKSAIDKLEDSFSIEATSITRAGMNVQHSLLKAVALVPFPAFKSARITDVKAEDNSNSDNGDEMKKKLQTPASEEIRPQTIPVGLQTIKEPERHFSFDEAVETICAIRSGKLAESEIHAALHDITHSSMTNAIAPQWLGELWSGIEYQRRVVPLVANKNLTGMKAKGWRWTEKPQVKTYSGDKSEVPTNSVSVEEVEVAAARWAGAHDIDRAFFDFNETEILSAYWRAMAESYARETDLALAKFMVDQAQAIGESADIIRAIARAGIRVLKNTDQDATFALVNPDDIEKVFEFAELDSPKFMDMVPVANPDKWVTSTQIPANTVVVGTRSAIDFFELSGSPLRVEAEHLTHGGRDAALFGYTAHSIVKSGGLVKATIKTA